ncbi:DUF6275 family protein [Methanobrevibacter sp.]|uniref:DUF6275 family protein n=1 Tax=Methanobrevibacter sp. TaxID=66852 RepID=UPI00386F3FBE
MIESDFREKCIDMVIEYYNSLVEVTDNYNITEAHVYIVWMASILGNNKALLSTTVPDGMYYEITYDNSNNTFYFDAYKKWNHQEYTL